MFNEEVLERIKSWLDADIEEQSLPLAVRQNSARLRDKIQEWENE
tara:strand:+ start:794 stop:928 length:135 start_codon:yes stop_codon:yes gene_type:complete